MTTELIEKPFVLPSAETIAKLLIKGDLSTLTNEQKTEYYLAVCKSLGLNPLTTPFSFIKFKGGEILYAKKDGTEQLRRLYGISLKITSREKIGDIYVVTAQASTPQNRVDESTGAISIGRTQGDELANQFMKAETKAKRRVTLSICGLGILDESELDFAKDEKQENDVEELGSDVKKLGSNTEKPKELTIEIFKAANEDQVKRMEKFLIEKNISKDCWEQVKSKMQGKQITGPNLQAIIAEILKGETNA